MPRSPALVCLTTLSCLLAGGILTISREAQAQSDSKAVYGVVFARILAGSPERHYYGPPPHPLAIYPLSRFPEEELPSTARWRAVPAQLREQFRALASSDGLPLDHSQFDSLVVWQPGGEGTTLGFSSVVFLGDSSQALVYAYEWCGFYCGDANIYWLRRRVDRGWVIRDTFNLSRGRCAPGAWTPPGRHCPAESAPSFCACLLRG
jgi:hypothetical protein